jgi:hypothetical protein
MVADLASLAARCWAAGVSGVEGPAQRAEAAASGDEALRAVLMAVGDGIGCEHWTLPEHGLPVVLLKDLGLARPITTRIPKCADHGCRYLGACPQESVFAEGRDGRSGRKFRLTPEGLVAASDAAVLATALDSLPLAADILAALASGEQTIFALHWALVEPRVAALGAGEEPPPMPSRAYLRAVLTLLAEHGAIVWDEAAGSVRRARADAPASDPPGPVAG